MDDHTRPTHMHGDVHSRYPVLPEGFTEHDGGPCPFAPDTRAEMMILTEQGLGSTGIVKVKLHTWDHPDYPVVGYRLHTGVTAA